MALVSAWFKYALFLVTRPVAMDSAGGIGGGGPCVRWDSPSMRGANPGKQVGYGEEDCPIMRRHTARRKHRAMLEVTTRLRCPELNQAA